MYGLLYLPVGMILGLSIAAPPGPMNALIANSSLKSPLHGTSVGAGAMTADFIFFLITFFIKGIIPKPVLIALYLIGGGYMLYLSYGVLKSTMVPTSKKGNYFIGLSVGITNPFQILWWLTVGIFMLTQFSLLIAPGFFLGISIWILTFPRLVNYLGYRYSKYIKIASFLVIFVFALFIIYSGLTQVF